MFSLILVTKTRTKTVNCDSHKVNCEELFLISGWTLGEVSEKFTFSVQTCGRYIALFWFSATYNSSNLKQNSVSDTRKLIIYQNLLL